MHINQLRSILDYLETQGITEVRCLDEHTTSDIRVLKTQIDKHDRIVDEERIRIADFNPYDRGTYQQIYEDVFKDDYPTFEAFYQFMETVRQEEVELIEGATSYIVISPSL